MSRLLKPIPPVWLLVAVLVLLIASGIRPQADRLTWFLETMPVMFGMLILVPTWRRFPFTPLAYHLMALHAVILIVGGYYTYAQVPLFNDLRDVLGFARNHYDRIGHIAQGFVPAIIARELLIRTSPLRPGKWLFAIVTLTCLGISALYELIEWAVALMSAEAAQAFLGTQGDNWDTQWDMFLALCGAIAAQVLLSRWHNRQIANL
ncbi:MAG: DUF2238 domain-containing protein [Gammaproteobacteria bacterium]|jgi:putative membrane protein